MRVGLGHGRALSVFCSRVPDHNIQLIISLRGGATGDITARMLAEELEKKHRREIIPNNKPGAGTVLGAETAIRAKKDGYTLFYGGASPLFTLL